MASKDVTVIEAKDQFAPRLSGKRVKIVIQKSQDKYAIDPVPLALNGHQITIRRGEKVDIPVEFLEVLELAVTTNYEQETLKDGSTAMVPREAPSYPFMVLGAA